LLKYGMCTLDCRNEGLSRHATASNVKTNSNYIESHLLGCGQHGLGLVEWASKLCAESADRLTVIRNYSEYTSSIWKGFFDLGQLVGVVECHQIHSRSFGIGQMRFGLAGIGKDDALGSNSQSQDA
jgi:hypothetical protein